MHFPRFWAKADSGIATCWDWSDHSSDDASAKARRRAEELERRLKIELENPHAVRTKYGYPDRPLREEVIEEHKDRGAVIAVVTRNAYGALILNTTSVMFLDIDLPAKPRAGLFQRLVGMRARAENPTEVAALERVEKWCQANRRWGFRVYRSAGGLRLLVTHELFEPERISRERVCDELRVDPLYRKLCETQRSFRARLTPKPWRCGLQVPTARWPWANSAAEAKFREWERRYAGKSESFATCKFLKECGSSSTHSTINLVATLHDGATKAHLELPLA